jgi:glutamine amidotransferase
MVGIVDYGLGNLLSVYSAFDYLGADVVFCRNPKELPEVDRIVIPGVGAFRDCISKLENGGFVSALNHEVLLNKKPVLGICLGMQVMAKRSYEFGTFEGLGWFDAEVIRIDAVEPSLRLPNIGWEEVQVKPEQKLFNRIKPQADFYFVHSYFMKCNEPNDVVATYTYGNTAITAAVQKENIFATQFHPEKSQDYGLQLLDNFLAWNP